MNRKFASFITTFITSGWLLLCLASTARAESTLDKIKRTGVLKVAIRQDAAPFGYLDANDNLQGYCLDFFTILYGFKFIIAIAAIFVVKKRRVKKHS